MIVKLAEFYGVTTDYLLGNSDDPNKTQDLNLRPLPTILRAYCFILF